MNKIKLFSLIYILVSFLLVDYSFAVGQNELDTSKENINIITGFFSTQLLLNIVFATIVIFLTFILSKTITSKLVLYVEKTAEGEGQGKEELIGVINRTVNISLLTLGFLISLNILGVDTSILMGGIGFGLGFALKTFLTNFISGILMVTQGYYHNGDLVKIGEQIGRIKNINALFTSIQQFDGIVFYVPNVKFMEENVSNYNANDKRRIEVKVGVDYSTDIVKAKKVLMQVIEQFPNVLQAPLPNVFVEQMGDSSVNLSLRFWVATGVGDGYLTTKSNVTETIHLAFRKAGITIPFPQVTLSNRDDFSVKFDK